MGSCFPECLNLNHRSSDQNRGAATQSSVGPSAKIDSGGRLKETVPTRPKGQLLHRHAKSGWRWAIRFTVHGRRRYLTLGRDADGWTPRRAEDELANVLADVRRDLWVEPGRGSRRRKRRVWDPLFGTFVAQLLNERRE